MPLPTFIPYTMFMVWAFPQRCTLLWGKAWSNCVTTHKELRAGKRLREQQHNHWSWDSPAPVAARENSCLAAARVICGVSGGGRALGLFHNALTTLTIQTMFSFPSLLYRLLCQAHLAQEGQSQALLWQAQRLETTAVATNGPKVTTTENH